MMLIFFTSQVPLVCGVGPSLDWSASSLQYDARCWRVGVHSCSLQWLVYEHWDWEELGGRGSVQQAEGACVCVSTHSVDGSMLV